MNEKKVKRIRKMRMSERERERETISEMERKR